MTEVTADAPPPKRGKMGPIVLAAVVLLAGGGGFGAGMMGLIPLPLGQEPAKEMAMDHKKTEPDYSAVATYYTLPNLMIPLGKNASSRYLRTTLFLEIDPDHEDILRKTEPRIMDTLNIFLRSVDERDVSSILALERLRGEILRRVRLVTGDDAVHAVLIGEFLLR